MSAIEVKSVHELQAGDRAVFRSGALDQDEPRTEIGGIVDSVSGDGWTVEDRYRPGRPERFPLVVLQGSHNVPIGQRRGMFTLVAATREVPETTPAPLDPSLLDQDGDDDGRDVAPLDPSKVKAGDTVTIVGTKAKVQGEVQDVQLRTGVGRVVKLHLSWFRIDGTEAWTLTAHQPAPKPEWKPGTSGTATVRTVPNIRVMRLDGVTKPWVSATFFAPAGDVKGEGQNRHDDWQVTDFVPDEPRPLPTREQVEQAINGATGLMTPLGLKSTTDAVMALLRGESR